ncbi:Bug family tripartite tricarboxylate transporter substrate binding protein [Ramlibacter sp.]|uniref:Bug family tripartite tricarboxylate transporter substrate binding protein n=1 Tax=Ramlibacter sp. TaxID=1917967 RepID=UPI003D132E1A
MSGGLLRGANVSRVSRRHLMIAAGGLALGSARAQSDFPNRPVKMITFFPPGGSADGTARHIADRMATVLGQSVVVENRPGAGSLLAARAALAAPADGYTMLFVGTSSLIATALYSNPGFSYLKDFMPIGPISSSVHLLVARDGVPVKTVQELIAYAKANPGKLNYASVGNGTSTHIEMEMFKGMTGTQITHIPYKGSAPAVLAMLAGDVDVMFDSIVSVLPHMKSGRMRALGISSATPSSTTPGVPPIATAVPGFDITVFSGLVVRAGTPAAIADRLNAALNKTLAMPDVAGRFLESGAEAMPQTRDEFGAFMTRDLARWSKVIADARIKVD